MDNKLIRMNNRTTGQRTTRPGSFLYQTLSALTLNALTLKALASKSHPRWTYAAGITLLCFIYFIFQLFNNQYTIWSVDEFWFAHRIYEFKNALPYRDFSPYKTVLGYYFLLPSMLLGHTALAPLLYTKHFIALLNTLFFAAAAYGLTRFFPKLSIFIALLLLISTAFVLQYSTNIRVDLLAYWLCLFSVLFLLNNQFLWAGITLGIAFLTSQKVLWYIAASDIALGLYWLFSARHKAIFWGAVLFNLALLITVAIYIAIWSWFAGLHTVLYNMFYEAYIMFQLDTYDSTRRLFWGYTLAHNPFVFLLWPVSFITLFVSPANDTLLGKRIFIVVYASVILFCLVPYKQVFPYYMLTTLPAFILLYTAFFSWMIDLLKNKSPVTLHIIGKEGLWGLIIVYCVVFLYINITFVLQPICLLIGFFALLLGIKITSNNHSTLLAATPAILFLITFFLGTIYPLVLLAHTFKESSGRYQQSMVLLTQALLQDGGDYLAGIELIYNKNQPIPGLRHLDVPALSYLYKPTEKLAKAMLASLYHTPDISIEKAIHYLESSSVKFYVNNYRIHILPPKIKDYLNANYTHFWGSVYLYAPSVPAGPQTMNIKFAGHYIVEASSIVEIDHIKIKPHETVSLTRGIHLSYAKTKYRLKLQENNVSSFLAPDYKQDQWLMMLG
jgi:hypothetical protein